MSTDEAVETGLRIARAVHEGNALILTHGWFIGTDAQCNYCNIWQVENMVGLGHDDPDVLQAVRAAARRLDLSGELMWNLNVRQFVFVRRPQ